MKVLYSTSVQVSGGRDGRARSADGFLDVALAMPKELGGKGGATNPEQLFAAGYAACFESALRHVARLQKRPIKESAVTAVVELHAKEGGGFTLAAQFTISLPGVDRNDAQALINAAHEVCPYSVATRGNMSVQLHLA